MYPQNSGADSRKLPPLHTGGGGGRDERWATYPPASSSIRSPTASYPASYNPTYAADHHYPYDMPMAGSMHMNHPEHRSTSPYHPQVPSSCTPPPISPISNDDSPNIKKKRKRADAAQLKILNEVYARTAFPSTEERQQLAKTLDMSARSVQIW